MIMPTYPKLTRVLRVFHDVLDVVGKPQDPMLKDLCQYLYYWLRYRLNKENRPIVIMPTHPKLTQVPRVIHDVLDVLGRPQESYPESCVSISLLLAEV